MIDGNCFKVSTSMRSSTRTALTAVSVAAMYSNSSAFGDGLVMMADSSRYFLRSSKACYCSAPH
jgi:hypothetical protein